MKRAIVCICLAVLLISLLSACGMGAVKETEAAIDAIGTVSLDSAEAIANARALYDALKENKKEKVVNYKLLEIAEGSLRDLQIQHVESLIEVIGTDMAVDQKAVKAARKAFDALDADMQSQVQNLDTLLEAEKKVEMLKHISDYAISNYQRIGTRRAKVFNESALGWYGLEDKCATAYICFTLQGDEEHTIDINKIGFDVYACVNKSYDRFDIYDKTKDGKVMCIQYWPSKDRAQVGTIETELSMQEYMDLLVAGGVVSSYKKISFESITRVLNAFNYAVRR